MSNNKDIFAVVGLPRSRTCWLANLLTMLPRSICFHEPECEFENLNGLVEKFNQTPVKHVGASSSGIPLVFDEFDKLFPDARYVVVMRDLRESTESYLKAFPFVDPDHVREMMAKCADGIDKIVGRVPFNRLKVVAFNRLSDNIVCENIHDFCLPDVPFYFSRCNQLQNMRVEMIWDKAFASAHPSRQAAIKTVMKGAV